MHRGAAPGLVPALRLHRHLDALVSAPQAPSVAKPEPRRDSYQLERQESFESSLERAESMSNFGLGEPALPE